MSSVKLWDVNVEGVVSWIARLEYMSRIYLPNKVLNKGAEEILKCVKRYCPRGATGQLYNSLHIDTIPDARVVTSHLPYARYVEEGTNPSPGRYVPDIGKRLVKPSVRNPTIGWHPGQKAQWFFLRGTDDAWPEVQRIFEVSTEEMLHAR